MTRGYCGIDKGTTTNELPKPKFLSEALQLLLSGCLAGNRYSVRKKQALGLLILLGLFIVRERRCVFRRSISRKRHLFFFEGRKGAIFASAHFCTDWMFCPISKNVGEEK